VEERNGNDTIIDAGPLAYGGGNNSAPTMGDLDGDGKADLLAGTGSGNVVYYKNIGTTGTARFRRVSQNFGGMEIHTIATPALGFIDGDDSLDLLVGRFDGPLRYYRNVSDSKTLVPETRLFYNYAKTKHETISPMSCAPALADLDGDGKLDIAIGNSRGGLLIYTSQEHKYILPRAGLVSPRPVEPIGVRIYPNPAKDNITVSVYDVKKPQAGIIMITDMLGRPVSEEKFAIGSGQTDKQLNLSTIANGAYTIRIFLPTEGRSAAKQIILVH
jgi:hypothetical protein